MDTWLRHWIMVGNISTPAEDALGSIGGIVEFTRTFHFTTCAVGLLYSNPPDDEVGYSISDCRFPNCLYIFAGDANGNVELVIYSDAPNPILAQASIENLHLVTLSEYLKLKEHAQ